MTALIGSVTTVLSVLAFAGVLWFACGASRRQRFEDAARAPFALPDDLVVVPAPHDTRAST